MHDDDRVWTVHLEQIPHRVITVPVEGPYGGDDLERVRTAILRYVSRVYDDTWRPRHFSIRPRTEGPERRRRNITL